MITYHDSHVFYFMSELCMHNHIDLINALSILLLLLLRSNRGLNSTGLTVYTTIFCVLQSTHITKYTVRAYHTEANSSPDPDPIFPSHANLESAKERQDTAIPYSMLHTQNPFSAKESCKGPDSVHYPLHRGPLPCHSMPFWINVPVQEITLTPYTSWAWMATAPSLHCPRRHRLLPGGFFILLSRLSLSSEIGACS